MNTLNKTFDPQTLADDLLEVRHIYAEFSAAIKESDWDKPVKGSPKEWNLHETIAHLCALNGDGLESLKHTLRGEPYTFVGLENRYKLNAFNRKGIDGHLHLPMKELLAEQLGILEEAAHLAHDLTPDQAKMTSTMPIYNRPVSIVEVLGIINFHAGIVHSAQVAEPAGAPPLWTQLSPDVRHRLIGRITRAFSLLYRLDLGGSLRDTIAFRIDGDGGGEWYVKLSPDAPTSGESAVENPGLVIHMRDTSVFCRMLTERLNLPLALIRGEMKLRGNLRLFLRMSDLFSTDARPRVADKNIIKSSLVSNE
jgi:SCP-2 sterol transfer family protein